MTRPSVVILGAGLSGLTLGRCLRLKGISSVIYERAPSTTRNNYGITLQPWAYESLLGVLGMDEMTFRKHVAVDSNRNDGIGRLSPQDSGSRTAFRANRNKLELLLGEGQTIKLNHMLSSAKVSQSKDSVELQFENGLEIRPAVVVDALGVHSQLRKSLLPDAVPSVQAFAVFSGKRHVKSGLFKSTYARAFGGGNILVRHPSNTRDPRLEVSVNEYLSNGDVSISYVYSRAARYEAGSSSDALYNPERLLTGATDIPEDFYDEVDDFITSHDVAQPFLDCFSSSRMRSDRLLHWLMRTVMVLKQDLLRLLSCGVVPLGDSVHAVPILGGHGANMAILDAIQVANLFTADKTVFASLNEFYSEKWDDWHSAVEKSKRDLDDMHSSPSVAPTASNL